MRTKQLEKRLKTLEEFLGVLLDASDPDYPTYEFRMSEYNMKAKGILGELYEAHKQNAKK